MHRYLIVSFLFLLSSCSRPLLQVHSEFVTGEELASYIVKTPDHRKEDPPVGQRLQVAWNMLEETGEIALHMRFGNMEEKSVRKTVHQKSGLFNYSLLRDDYFSKKGISTYRAELIVDGEVVAEWHHALWTPLVRVGSDIAE